VNANELWDESTAYVTFNAKRGGPAALVTPSEAAVVLKGIRSDIRRVVTAYGGEVLDSAEGEGYRERWMVIPYKLDRVFGTIRLRFGPATGLAEETTNRLDVVIREQPEQ
jgi:hypothetical protein